MNRPRRILHLVGAAALATAGIVGLAGGTAGAASDVATGWWWRANPGGTAPTPTQAPVVVGIPTTPVPTTAPPAPPNVGDGNLMVAATPDGATAIAAVRATGATGQLTLTVAPNGSVGGQAAKLLACKTGGLWNPAQGGRWDDKPSYSCDASSSAPGTASADGATWTFPTDALTTDGVLDVAIVPAPADATTGLTAPFQIVFQAPGADAFGSAASKDTATTDFQSTYDYSAPAGDFSAPTADFSSDFSTDDFSADSSFDLGTTGAIAAPAVPKAKAKATPRVGTLQQAPASARGVVPASDDAKTFALIVVLLAAAAGYWVTRQQVPALQGLGRVAVRSTGGTEQAPVEAGLGRFKKVRTGPPPRLF
jgi:hypothetical protein